ncbi:hypothetical protein ACQUEF_03445 [Vagococcus fluvialis]|uniref:hypothetical protein n=1 Tax=Vagococcus fluvialis TaxID=2738 RepID=UPI003D0FF739
MIGKFKELTSKQKLIFIYIIFAIILFILTLIFGKNAWSFVHYFLFIGATYPAQSYYQKNRIEEINHMWSLADKLQVSTAKLSEVTGIGRLDLEATKRDKDVLYLPPKKDIQKGISYLESLN